MNKRNKGFTLIELLAVIVILVIIFVIVVPVIGNVITRARYGAFGTSKKGIERAAELYYSSNAKDIVWENDIAYVEVGTLKSKKYLKSNIVSTLDNLKISDDTKVLLYKKDNKIEYSLQLYNDIFFSWYQEQMIAGSKKSKNNLPVNIGEIKTIELSMLMEKGLTDELRLPLSLEDRCVGYVEIEKTGNNKYDYEAYVDCLTEASSFASHYVSYGGKYLDEFNDVIETSDGGYVAVGRSNSENITKYGTGNNGKYDAIIVKFKQNGEVEWSRNFGGSNDDLFNSVVESPNGYVAVGQTTSNDSDIIDYKGGPNDALIVAYDEQGNVTYKRSYGSDNSLSNSGNEAFYDIIRDGNNYVIIGTAAGYGKDGDLEGVTKLVRQSEGIILKMDSNFNTLWREFFVGTYNEIFRKVIKTQDNNYMVAGSSSSKNYDMEGIGYTTPTLNTEAIVLKYGLNGGLNVKKSFQGENSDTFHGLLEVSDGYILIGESSSSTLDMTNLSKADNGYKDAIIVKYDKKLENVLWKKVFGGTEDDVFYDIKLLNSKEVIVVGYSKSDDKDLDGIVNSTNGYSNAIIIKFAINNGNIIDKKVFGGTNSEIFNTIIKTTNSNYIMAGYTFSNNQNLQNFNKGHSDAVLTSYDNNLNLIKKFQEPVVIIDKLKTIQVNYGTNISLKYDVIYTSNDPTKDLNSWCSSVEQYLEGNTSNYHYGNCLRSFNEDDMKLLVEKETTSGLHMYVGEHEYPITVEPNNIHNWYKFFFGHVGEVEFSNLKLKFADGYTGSIIEAINNGYIEPMVSVWSTAPTSRPSDTFPDVIDIINSNGTTGIGSYPGMNIHVKPKKSKLISIIFTTNKNTTTSYGLEIYELRNFDMSITPTS